jgi:transcription factor SPT20
MLSILTSKRMLQYLGSLIVEIHDHRDQPVGEPVSERVVLWPNDETLYAEICLAASKDPGKWTDLDALTFEASHLVCAQ